MMPSNVEIFSVILIHLHSICVSDSAFTYNNSELFKIVGILESTRFVISQPDSPKEDLFVSVILVATLFNLSCYHVLKNY